MRRGLCPAGPSCSRLKISEARRPLSCQRRKSIVVDVAKQPEQVRLKNVICSFPGLAPRPVEFGTESNLATLLSIGSAEELFAFRLVKVAVSNCGNLPFFDNDLPFVVFLLQVS